MTLPHPSTFSIVAHDPEAQEWGVAVQSKFLCVGALVPWAKAGVGAIATQSFCNTSFGPDGLTLMASGLSAQEALDRVLAEDEGRSRRQVGFIDANTRAIFGRSYAAEPELLIEQLSQDQAIAEADTLLLTVPNQLGVDYNAHVIESVVKHVAPGLGWR